MSFQKPPIQRQTSEPFLLVGGMAWDLSNLCSTQNESYSLPPDRRLDRSQSYQCYPTQRRRREQSIYPSKEELRRDLPADIDTSDIFDRSRSARSPSGGVRHRTQSCPSGAKDFEQLLKFPSMYDRYAQTSSSDICNEQQERNYSRYEVLLDSPPIPVSITDYSSDASSQRSSSRSVERERTPVQVEVHPGVFFQLRGAKETIEAIASGHSKSVSCYACGVGLRCVADCKLVICPDCRIIMSPVPRKPAVPFQGAECDDEYTSCTYWGPLPQFTPLWRDDDESFHSSKQKSNMHSRNGISVGSTGGVGLGLRIEN
jgi:hypothetical protein